MYITVAGAYPRGYVGRFCMRTPPGAAGERRRRGDEARYVATSLSRNRHAFLMTVGLLYRAA